jgi:CRP/FNR family cyclic AMP-dependent transcriptional regulator
MRDLDEKERFRAMQALANYPLFGTANGRALEPLLSAARFSSARAREIVRTGVEGQATVVFVLRGAVRVFHRLDDGREFTPKFLCAPNHFGDLQPLAGLPLTIQSVEVVEEATLATVAWKTLETFLRSDHQATLAWLSGLASQFVYTIDSDRHNALTGLPGRVANVLLTYAQHFGERDRTSTVVRAPLSRDQLARHVGSIKRSVIRVIRTFEEKGLVDARGQDVVIRSSEGLAQETLPKRVGLGHAMQHDIPLLVDPK